MKKQFMMNKKIFLRINLINFMIYEQKFFQINL